MSKLRTFLSKKLVDPLLQQLKQGASPEKLGWSVSLGAAFGLFPIMGSTTLLCGAAGALLRLNHVALQTVNYLMYPAQLILIPIFLRIGERVAGAPPISIDLSVMKQRFAESPALFFQDFGLAGLHGVLAWLIVMPIPTWLASKLLARVFSGILKKS